MPVTVRDNGFSNRVKMLVAMQPASITVGIHGEEGAETEGDTTVATIANAHEFGLGVPRRSFLRSWAEENAGRNAGILSRALERCARGDATYPQTLHSIGSVFVADCRLRIARGQIGPALSPETVDRKGSSTPLLDTGQLSAAIRYKFEAKADLGATAQKGKGGEQDAKRTASNRKRAEKNRARAAKAKAAKGAAAPPAPAKVRTVRQPRKAKP